MRVGGHADGSIVGRAVGRGHTRTCGRRRSMQGRSSWGFGAWSLSGCRIPSCIDISTDMVMCCCICIKGHLAGVDERYDVSRILVKWQFGRHKVFVNWR